MLVYNVCMCTYTAVYVQKYKYLKLYQRLPGAATEVRGTKAGADRRQISLLFESRTFLKVRNNAHEQFFFSFIFCLTSTVPKHSPSNRKEMEEGF